MGLVVPVKWTASGARHQRILYHVDMEVTVRVLVEFAGESRLAVAVYVQAGVYLSVSILRLIASAWRPAARG